MAIIGLGPRGLYALEQFLRYSSHLSNKNYCHILIFEPQEHLGAGSVWRIEQPSSNWLNISERSLEELPKRPEINGMGFHIPGFPAYRAWSLKNGSTKEGQPDVFPPRSKLGTYLNARFKTLAKELIGKDIISIYKENIHQIAFEKEKFLLTDENSRSYEADEVLLTVGHQPTKLSNQLKSWKEHASTASDILLFEKAYPIERLTNEVKINHSSVIGLRGFGLSMLDAMRALTIDRGGEFIETDSHTLECSFKTTPKVPKTLLPFSLEGLPLAPKPLNESIDKLYEPTQDEVLTFKKSISEVGQGKSIKEDAQFLKDEIVKIVVRVYAKLPNKIENHTTPDEIKRVSLAWLEDEKFQHPLLLNHQLKKREVIERFIQMALNKSAISLDYCIGQVWRHLQSTWYDAFSHANQPEETIARVIDLHERLKRYSYGPPLKSMQQLMALLRAGIMDLSYVSDPKIELVETGWKLTKNQKAAHVNCMVNCVLDSPKLLKIKSPVVVNLLKDKLIEPIHTELGLDTYKNGLVKCKDKSKNIPLAVLGRLSKGSVVGVDAILECFDGQVSKWAEESAARILGEQTND